MNADATYLEALNDYRTASQAFTLVTAQYRVGDIGDTEFLAARADFAQAQQALDAAEVAYMAATGADLEAL